MKINKTAFGLTLLACAALMIAATDATQAGTQQFTVIGAELTRDLHINNGGAGVGNPYNGTARVGRYTGKFADGTAVTMFCVDARHFDGTPFTTLDAASIPLVSDGATAYNATARFYEANGVYGGIASALTKDDYIPTNGIVPSAADAALRASQVAYLVDKWGNATFATVNAGRDQMAAVQLAIWDILQDGGDGMQLGSFMSNANSYYAAVNAVLADASSIDSSYVGSAIWIEAQRGATAGAHVQDWAYTPVPEPVFMQMGALVGLSGAGLLRRRRSA